MANRFNVAILLAAVHLASSAFAETGTAKGGSRIDFEMTGVVLDSETKKPLEGAYVLALYMVTERDSIKVWCSSTKGMFTGADGKFRFPVEKRDGLSPHAVSAVKPDFAESETVMPPRQVWMKQGAEAYSNIVIYLTKQKATSPTLQIGSRNEFCDRAVTKEDAAASIQFLKLEYIEMKKYGAVDRQLAARIDQIKDLESLPSRQTTKSGKP